MSKVKIQLSGVAAELALGNYMPKDETIYNNWEDFYRFNDLIHESVLLTDHIAEIEIRVDDNMFFKGKIPETKFLPQKSFIPFFVDRALYLRTECAERVVFNCEFEVENFYKNKLFFETQDYNLLFKVGKSFVKCLLYDNQYYTLDWESGQHIGELCILCRYENGFLVPLYDAVNKLTVGSL
jgi:hypothetical protein